MAKSDLTLDDVYALVQLQYNALNRAFEETSDPDEMGRILVEMKEFTHRLDLLQRQRMDGLSADLSRLTNDLKDANTQLAKALKSLSDINDVLKTCSAFLDVIDQIIDLVKLV